MGLHLLMWRLFALILVTDGMTGKEGVTGALGVLGRLRDVTPPHHGIPGGTNYYRRCRGGG